MRNFTLYAADGYPLCALYGTPVEPSDRTVVLSSATGVRKEFYLPFAQYLVQQGYNVLLFDYRGIGGSAPADLRGFTAYMHEWGTLDMNAALDYVVNEKGQTGITWLGHSVGAQMVPLLHNRGHIARVVAVNAALGYWGYFPFPHNLTVWTLWHLVQPLLVGYYGYGNMRKIGWGENLPANVLAEWKDWCVRKRFFADYLRQSGQQHRYDEFDVPLTAVYTSDDYIANDKTVTGLLRFFPNAPQRVVKLWVKRYTKEKVGHTGLFRKRFERSLWPVLVALLEGSEAEDVHGSRPAAVEAPQG